MNSKLLACALLALGLSLFYCPKIVAVTGQYEEWSSPCRGFNFTSPPGGNPLTPSPSPTIRYPVNSTQQIQWTLGNSKVTTFWGVELFNMSGLIADILVGERQATDLSANVGIKVPSSVNVPGIYFWRMWGRAGKGPDCVVYSVPFEIVEEAE
ncbi:hypothetical protein BC938DRAFT_480710 [Jimgerdemannia flammicorona]|uniref:Uncharacterized protein n=1 Tax=Jimgerdemannia flammicorona TaxID=994334 RepID=A0A433QHX3_9FUNG|nr:hypothetical protein BC938DRAFT_480710 [Jimgerdemannia flammicorona]